jgi:hypothetical protein
MRDCEHDEPPWFDELKKLFLANLEKWFLKRRRIKNARRIVLDRSRAEGSTKYPCIFIRRSYPPRRLARKKMMRSHLIFSRHHVQLTAGL